MLVAGGWASLVAREADLGGRGNVFLASMALSRGEKVATDELLAVPSPPPSDDLMRDSPELLEYADNRLESDPEGDTGSGGLWAAVAGLATGLLGMDMGGGRTGAACC